MDKHKKSQTLINAEMRGFARLCEGLRVAEVSFSTLLQAMLQVIHGESYGKT